MILTLIAILTIGITLYYVPQERHYDSRYCNARTRGSDTHEAWAYYETKRGERIREYGHTGMPEYPTLLDFIHDNKSGAQCAKEMAQTEAFFFIIALAMYVYFYFISKSYYLEGSGAS